MDPGPRALRALSSGEEAWKRQRTPNSGLAPKPGPGGDGKMKCPASGKLIKTAGHSDLLLAGERMNEG